MIVRYRERALADIEGIRRYLDQHSPSGAFNVLQAIYAGVHLVSTRPLACPRIDILDVRVKIVTRYRYKIFFSFSGDVIDILHVRHMSRRPWPNDAEPL